MAKGHDGGEKMLEVEVKGKVIDLKSVESRARDLGFSFVGTEDHCDIYFRHPNRDFAVTDEALRIRKVNGRSVLTYKGPKVDKVSKTREEIEIALKGDMDLVLKRLGFVPVLEVKKVRRVFHKADIEICLDDVSGLGTYVEVECKAQSANLDAIRERVMSVVKALGLKEKDLERRAYLELLLSKK